MPRWKSALLALAGGVLLAAGFALGLMIFFTVLGVSVLAAASIALRLWWVRRRRRMGNDHIGSILGATVENALNEIRPGAAPPHADRRFRGRIVYGIVQRRSASRRSGKLE